MQACPDGAVDFRDVQCADTNDILFFEELLAWESFEGQCMYCVCVCVGVCVCACACVCIIYSVYKICILYILVNIFCCTVPPEVTPCQLYCQTEDDGITDVRASSVIDGTKCVSHESPSAVCVQGSCIVSVKFLL